MESLVVWPGLLVAGTQPHFHPGEIVAGLISLENLARGGMRGRAHKSWGRMRSASGQPAGKRKGATIEQMRRRITFNNPGHDAATSVKVVKISPGTMMIASLMPRIRIRPYRSARVGFTLLPQRCETSHVQVRSCRVRVKHRPAMTSSHHHRSDVISADSALHCGAMASTCKPIVDNLGNLPLESLL